MMPDKPGAGFTLSRTVHLLLILLPTSFAPAAIPLCLLQQDARAIEDNIHNRKLWHSQPDRQRTNTVLAMSCLTQFGTVNLIHHYCDIGVWTRMAIKFSERVAFVDDRTDGFLTTLAHLGGYCTAEQAQEMGLAKSPSQVQMLLNGLERAGFLR